MRKFENLLFSSPHLPKHQIHVGILIFCFFLSRSIYPVNKVFFLVETIDHSKHYKPSSKIIIDVQAGVNLFLDRVGIVKHVVELTKELCDKWNAQYYNQPQVNLKESI